MRIPTTAYTVWHTQRTGSTWLCQALESTNAAGRPEEWFNVSDPEELLSHHGASDVSDLLKILYKKGSTPNGVFGIKQGFSEPYFSRLIALLKDGRTGNSPVRLDTWESVFPNHKHIFMTRRNKVRLAVSWWRAIQSDEWHRRCGAPAQDTDLTDCYSFDAIDRLLNESVFREAGLQELFEEASVVPLTIVYEDLLHDIAPTILRVMRYLGVLADDNPVFATDYEKIADDLSEEWVQRFRREKQAGWQNIAW